MFTFINVMDMMEVPFETVLVEVLRRVSKKKHNMLWPLREKPN